MGAIHETLVGEIPSVFYHGTNEDRFEKIVAEGVLWGVGTSYRYTYLAPDVGWPIAIATSSSRVSPPVILEVRYTPGSLEDNFGFYPPLGEFCTQFCVFNPITLVYVSRLSWLAVKKLRVIQVEFFRTFERRVNHEDA